MGGIISAKFILLDELTSFIVKNDSCELSLSSGAKWKDIDAKARGINITVEPVRDNAGLIYNITGSILIKKSDENIPLLRVSQYIILQYTNTDRITNVAGTDEYPLQVTLRPLTPSDAVGFLGYELEFEGNQLIEPPFLGI